MMMKKKETAEQQLLKLIEVSSGGAAAVSFKTTKQVFRKQSLISVVKTVNRFLLVGIIAVVALLLNEVIGGMALVNKKITFTLKPTSGGGDFLAENIIPKLPGINFYLSRVEKRNFFQPYERVAATPVVDASGKNRRLSQMIQRFKLVGISWMDQLGTASVMIEDKDKGMTHYRKKGEAIDGITVKDIYKDSALLGYENEEIIIKYDKSQM